MARQERDDSPQNSVARSQVRLRGHAGIVSMGVIGKTEPANISSYGATSTGSIRAANRQLSRRGQSTHTRPLSDIGILQQLTSANAENGDVRNLDAAPQSEHPRCDFNHKSVFSDGLSR